MKTLMGGMAALFLLISCCCCEVLGFSQEDFLENLLESDKTWDSDEFKMLGGLNDDVLIEMKVSLTSHKRSHLCRIAEVIVKNNFERAGKYEQIEIDKAWSMVHKCSEIEDQIWLIIKARRLWEEKNKQSDNRLAEKPHSLQ